MWALDFPDPGPPARAIFLFPFPWYSFDKTSFILESIPRIIPLIFLILCGLLGVLVMTSFSSGVLLSSFASPYVCLSDNSKVNASVCLLLRFSYSLYPIIVIKLTADNSNNPLTVSTCRIQLNIP